MIRMGGLSGLSMKESLLLTPGELWDVWALYLRANRPPRRSAEDIERE
jgi:hypothetical protein